MTPLLGADGAAPDGDGPDADLCVQVTEALTSAPGSWDVVPAENRMQPWIRAAVVGERLPGQGWKLHVSSHPSNAHETLARVLPVLATSRATFKVVGSVAWLAMINRGTGGLSQVGKFLTVFPADDAAAVTLAAALDQATHGLRGPVVVSDRPVSDDSVVSYRYGGFGEEVMQTPLGEIVLALRDPDGRLVPDPRGLRPVEPDWVSNPFVDRGLTVPAARIRVVAGRYRPVATLNQTPETVVQLALDTREPRACMLKRAPAPRPGDHVEPDAGWLRVRREAAALARLAGAGVTPTTYDLVETEHEIVLVTEDLGGQTLTEWMSSLAGGGTLPDLRAVAAIVQACAEALALVHARGTIHGDVKPTNIILTSDHRPYLIDFELGFPIGSMHRPPGAGTRGYVSPDCRAGRPPAASDDVFAFGAVLYLLLTGAEPSRAPDAEQLLRRPITRLAPHADPALATLAEHCLAPESEGRPTLGDVVVTLRDLRDADALCAETVRSPAAPRPSGGLETTDRRELLARVRRAGDFLCRNVDHVSDGVVWRSTHRIGKGVVGRDINTGMAGTVLALAEVVHELAVPEHSSTLGKAARTLARLPTMPGAVPQGLYIGEMGVAVALLRAGLVLGEARLVAAALERTLAQPRPAVGESPDLFHGLAGRARSSLMVWDATGDARCLAAARACGDALCEGRDGVRTPSWPIPAGYSRLSGHEYLGYAHGTAGIADALLDLADATGHERYLEVARSCVTWLADQAVPTLGDGSGLAWPATTGGQPHTPFWCHGASGVGRLLLSAVERDVWPGATELLAGICRAVARTRWSGPTLCHGLAGNAEFLLDAGRALDDDGILADAHELLALIEDFAIDDEVGRSWITDAPRQVSPDYLVGYAGLPVVLLRFAVPGRSVQLSRAGFRS